jgi:uncharacterized protein (TIGR02246 family)
MAQEKAEKEILELEKRYWQALKDNDLQTCLELTDDPCIVSGAQGFNKINKAQFSEMMKSANYTLDDFKVEDGAEVRLLGDDVAVLAYKVHEELTLEGKKVQLDAAESSTWIKRDGRWVCTMHTESLLGDPFGRDRERSAVKH